MAFVAAAVAGWNAESYAGALVWNLAIAAVASFLTIFFFGDMRDFSHVMVLGTVSSALITLLPNAIAYLVAREHRRYGTSNQA
ncbi:hypothetical protein MWN34_09225 [Ancylobacter sp. 6x-1]|uniref:Uncharacterized protein n=1 Tax=Ancylobacter crimeensis TaxID=2579147 RepID=A0ABT0DAV6_9HYPH|nr:hypothetical protein [Ancylobacter crimeensis]MCK0197091.1 hypothetical protein [Ancylobacter crimeensis]